ncbi:MAG: beta-L-arabinofuranosidase domain-containing protein [Thermoguttaceae bacterium]
MRTLLNAAIILTATTALASAQAIRPHPLIPIPIQQVVVEDEFWSPKLKLWREVTIPDCFAKFEKDGALTNFDRIRDGTGGEHGGPPWYDGLIYEMIRGCADFLAANRDAALEARLDGYIERIAAAAAKDPDGYLNTYTQLKEPTHRWGLNGGNDVNQHDVYNAGCLIEAGVHYYRATGKITLLRVAAKQANYMCKMIGPAPKKNVIPGHSLAEEALVRMYELFREQPNLRSEMRFAVDEQKYLKLAEFFIEARGHYLGRKSFGAYGQDHKPVFEQESIEGHAVRATLMATGVAAIAATNQRPEYCQTALRLWENMVGRKLYITGGVGATSEGEAFGPEYILPNDGYLETCAAIGSGFFSRNMNLVFGEARFADELELVVYNGALGHVSQAGNTYSYVNPLVFHQGHSRWSWHPCPCCPPMFLKIMGALPGYIYAQDANSVYVNLFVSSRATLTRGGRKTVLHQTTKYPWEGVVTISVQPEKEATFDLCVRVPAWCQRLPTANDLYPLEGLPEKGAFSVKVDGAAVESVISRGYARIGRTWKKDDVVEVLMKMPPRRVRAPKVPADKGLVALKRGPLVYAIEPGKAPCWSGSLFLPPDSPLSTQYRPDLLGGVVAVKCRLRIRQKGEPSSRPADLEAIPYFAYLNRGPSEFRVWIPEAESGADAETLTQIAIPTASHCNAADSVFALKDGIVPAKSSDSGKPRMSWWDHKGTAEWVQYDFAAATTVSKIRVFWFADRPLNGGCDLPQSWRLLYRTGNGWTPVKNPSDYGLAADRFNEVTFTPVTAAGLRLEVQLKPGWSGGICEWEAE